MAKGKKIDVLVKVLLCLLLFSLVTIIYFVYQTFIKNTLPLYAIVIIVIVIILPMFFLLMQLFSVFINNSNYLKKKRRTSL